MHLAELLKDLLYRLKTGQAVAVPPTDELEFREAADLLQISPAELEKLNEEGRLSFHQVGLKRVLYREDLQAYQAQLLSSAPQGRERPESELGTEAQEP